MTRKYKVITRNNRDRPFKLLYKDNWFNGWCEEWDYTTLKDAKEAMAEDKIKRGFKSKPLEELREIVIKANPKGATLGPEGLKEIYHGKNYKITLQDLKTTIIRNEADAVWLIKKGLTPTIFRYFIMSIGYDPAKEPEHQEPETILSLLKLLKGE